MLKKILFFGLCFIFVNIAHAEIKEFTNSFDNSKYIYSVSEKTKLQFPKFFSFRKIIRPDNTKYYISIKINDDVIYSCPTTISTLSDLTTQATILLNDEIINNFGNIQKITFQIPVFMERSSLIESYYYVELPKVVFTEWQQVISKE